MKRIPLPPRRIPLRRVSKKRAREGRVYTKKRRAYLEANSTCQICESDQATEIHHRAGRIGAKLNDETNFLALCRTCHRWVHERPSEARRLGYLL
jgi:hypothetical protein